MRDHARDPHSKKHFADRFTYSGIDRFRIALRLRAALKAFGPMTTDQLIRRAGAEFSERDVRLEIKRLEERGVISRPIQHQRWRVDQ